VEQHGRGGRAGVYKTALEELRLSQRADIHGYCFCVTLGTICTHDVFERVANIPGVDGDDEGVLLRGLNNNAVPK
jgi:hypothetical protein